MTIDMAGDFPILRLAPVAGDTAIFFSDVHYPIQDRAAMSIVVQAHQLIKPKYSIAGGDIFDCAPLSTHRTAARQAIEAGSLALEAEAAQEDLDEIAANTDYAMMLAGNHPARVERFIDDNPGLYGALKWYDPYASALSRWDCLPDGSAIKLGPIMCFHGDELAGSLRKQPASGVLAEYPGQSTIFGHCHRRDSATRPSYRDGRQVVHGAWTFGYLGDARRFEWAGNKRHAWEQGFGVIRFWERDSGKLGFSVDSVRIYPTSAGGRVAMVDGKVLRG